jgi:hypothetical protein
LRRPRADRRSRAQSGAASSARARLLRAALAAALALAPAARSAAHALDPAHAAAEIAAGPAAAELGVLSARPLSALPRLLHVTVDARWDAAAPERRVRAAERWRALWRAATPGGTIAVTDVAGRSRVAFDAAGRAALAAPATGRAGPAGSTSPRQSAPGAHRSLP